MKTTVKALIDKLSKYSPDMPVVIPGYDSGYNDADLITQKLLYRNVNAPHDYDGEHDTRLKNNLDPTPAELHLVIDASNSQ